MAAPSAASAITDGEADRLLGALGVYEALVLAVSGGADSTALMHVTAAWRRRHGRDAAQRLLVVTVDHRLRAGSADEATAVARQAAALGLQHRTVTWDSAKPSTGIQAAARDARYRLLITAALDLCPKPDGAVAIVTAHTADDQAETVLMRLARGSGVDGLAAIPAAGRLRSLEAEGPARTIAVLRPLLTVTRDRLLATLRDAGVSHIDDPSNADDRFERVRARAMLKALAPLGLTATALSRTAARMDAARVALDASAAQTFADAVRLHFGLICDIDRAPFERAPGEIRVRVLREALHRAGDPRRPAELSSVEALVEGWPTGQGGTGTSFTIGGCRIDLLSIEKTDRRRAVVYRETDRAPGLARLTLEPGQRAIWDGRVRICVSPFYTGTVEIGALGDDARELARLHAWLADFPLPLRALAGLPAFRRDGRLVAVPHIAELARQAGDHAAFLAIAGPGADFTTGTTAYLSAEAILFPPGRIVNGA